MKKIIAVTLISTMALFGLSNDEVELFLLSKAAEKKAVVMANMDYEGKTKEAFGDLYDEYQVSLMKQRLKELEIITHYSEDYRVLDDAASNKLITEWLSVEEAEMVLKKEYIAKFKKIIPSSDVIRYFQIENRLQLANELQRASLIPLALPTQASKQQ